MELTKMSEEDLLKHRNEVDVAIEKVRARRRDEAVEAMQKAAAAAGFTLEDLLGKDAYKSVRKGKKRIVKSDASADQRIDPVTGLRMRKGAKRAHPPKYIHPQDTSKTWSGYGRTPAWLQEMLDNGKSKEDFLITGL